MFLISKEGIFGINEVIPGFERDQASGDRENALKDVMLPPERRE
jgi:hypothetical protein